MKIPKITRKNLKLLLRSKTSLLVIIFGPLLIMLLVGFAFNNPAASKLNIGYYANEKTNLTYSFIDALNTNANFDVLEYPLATGCTDMIEQGKVHICIIFPDAFSIENNKTNEILFYVDQSRANFVYAVIDTVSSKVQMTSNKLSYQMTNDLLTVISHTKTKNSDNLLKIIRMKNLINEISTDSDSIKTGMNSLNFTKSSTNSESLSTSSIDSDLEDLESKIENLIDAAEDVSCDSGFAGNLTATYEPEIANALNTTNTDLDALSILVANVATEITKLNQKLDVAKTTTTDSVTKLTDIQSKLSEIKTDIDSMKTSIESLNAEINALKVTSAESIVNPITTTIKPVSAKTNNLNFIFPYVIILIIVFISIMLSSTMIIMEKNSKAYFRTFTTPTKAITFITSIFLTNVLVVVVQLFFILILAYYFLQTSILANIGLTLLVITGAITLFTLLGMIIGYMFKSQEAATMASISVGSVLLFLSNLILPLETMSVYIQEAAKYNPYVVASELLKKITLFNSTFTEVHFDFMLLGLYILIALVLVFVVERISRVQYLNKKPLHKLTKKDEILDRYFKLKSGVLLKDEKDLLIELKIMSDLTFDEYVDKNKNDFETWMIMNNKPKLAEKIGACKTREELIKVLGKEKK